MKLMDAIGRINILAGEMETRKTARQVFLSAAKLLRGPAAAAREQMEGIAEVARLVEEEAASWIDPKELRAGKSGPFDTCDMRHWLVLAERAGVPFVPAREILSLSEEELSAIAPTVTVPNAALRSIERGLEASFPGILEERSRPSPPGPDRGEILERLFSAMEDVPSDWMVRSNLSGSSMLKSLAGTGLISDAREGAMMTQTVATSPFQPT